MSLNFDDGTEEPVTIADIAAARFLQGESWTFLAFFRVEDTSGDDRMIFSKWQGVNQNQFRLRTDMDATPSRIEIGTRDITTSLIGTSEKVAEDTWYCIAVVNIAGGGAGDFTFHLIDMSGAVIDSVSDQHDGDVQNVDLPALWIGARPASDEFDGDIDYVCYIQQALTQAQVIAYTMNPYKLAMSLQDTSSNVVFFVKLGHGGNNAIDLSGNDHGWAASGTTVASDPPPVAPMFGWDAGLSFPVGVAEIITVDKWHPEIQRPYIETPEIVVY